MKVVDKKEATRLLLKLKQMHIKLEKMPTKQQFIDAVGAKELKRALDLFGSWRSFTLAARYSSPKRSKRYSSRKRAEQLKKELIRSLKRVEKELNKVPTVAEFNKYSGHDHHTVERAFNSWDEFLEAAGLSTRVEEKKRLVLEEYQTYKTSIGRPPKQGEFGKNGLKVVCLKTAIGYYGGWKNLVKAASE